MASYGHTGDLSSMEEVEEEVLVNGTADVYASSSSVSDFNNERRFILPPTASPAYEAEPLSLVMERSPPHPAAAGALTQAEPKLEPLQTAFSSTDDGNYYLEPMPPRNADSAPPSFGGT